MASALTGTVIGTSGSYNNDGDTIAKAFDKNFNTYFDAPTANGNWVGLNLGTPATITQVQYAPRATLQTRMVGGIFQGSNTADFSSGVVNLFTITTAPVVGSFTAQPITNAGTFQYVRYLSPNLSYGNISELEFDGTPVTTTTGTKLTGTVIGTAGSYGNGGNTIAKVFDSNLSTFFDAPTGNGNYVGLALTTPADLTQIQYAPRASYASRMVGGIFQGSNDPNFATGVANLFTITTAPTAGVFTTVPITTSTAYQYFRYLAPANSYGNVAEIEFDGTPVTQPSNKLTGTVFGTAGSYQNDGNTIAKVFDSNLSTFFDGPGVSVNDVGEAFGSEAILTQIKYAPRSGYASRMVGGIFQGSNDSSFGTGVTNLCTITTTPPAGVFTTAPINTTAAFKYVRYLAPAGSNGNVAEIEFDGTLTGIQPQMQSPSVATSSPANGATNVDPTGFISCALNLPNGTGINPGTMTATTVYLYRTFDHTIIPTEVNTDAVGSVIVLQPQSPLDANTNYTFVVTSGVTDNSGAAFIPFTMSFTTGAQTAPTDPSIAFQKVALPTATGQEFTCVTMGPDGDLYATTLTGAIYQFPVNADGTLGAPVNLTANDPSRLITGVAFDPSSTATNMKLWISSGSPIENNAPDWSGTISAITITGSTASTEQNYIIGLPRSNSNHLNDQPVFGPDGALYWCQGSNTSMGAPDAVWGYRPEHLLNAAILRLNIQAVEQYVATNHQPLNVQTDSLPAGQTPYDPTAPGAPLTLYVTGIRNAYDLIWDTNGHLYVPTNGSAAGGNIPATPPGVTPAAPAENGVGQAEDDYLYDVTPGHYYGHPNPSRGEYIFGGGNPVNPKPNTAIQAAYPLGTNPDPRYGGYAYDFGVHYSPDGAIEYQGNAFGGALNGALLITRYSGGKDIIVLRTGSSGQITEAETGITGFTQYSDPVDITEDDKTGNLYIADLGTGAITLLRPISSSGAAISQSTTGLYFNDPVNAAATPAQNITISNIGTQPLAIPATGMQIVGSDAPLFIIASKPQLPLTIAPGASITIGVVFNPGSSAIGLHTAQLQIASNDPKNPLILIDLRALTTRGLGGTLEPSLQSILNLFQIPDNVGTADPSQTYFNTPPLTPNDEVVMPELEKAGTGPVTITPLATFSADITPSAGFGYYSAGTPDSRMQLFTISASGSQSVDPTAVGATTFDPGSSVFGIFASFDAFPNPATGTARIAYSEDVLNTYYDAVNTRKVRFYPLKNSDGSIVPNAFVFATEDYGVAPNYDSNDLVGIIRNVKAAPAAPKIGTENVVGTDTESASSPTQFVFNSIQNLNTTAPNVFHSTDDLRILNTGSLPLVISSMNSSNAFFSVTTPISYPLTIAAGSSLDLTLAYNPAHTGLNAFDTGTLTINSNDPATPALNIQLSGIWQVYGNMTPDGTYTEPSVPQIVKTFGFTTTILNPGQVMNQNGQIETVGQEVLSSYWTRVDTNLPVTVQQLAAFHTEGNGSTLYWYSQGHSTSFNTIVNAVGDNAQSLLPLESDSTKKPAFGTFTPTGNFGFNVDKSEFSDNTLNAHGGTLDQGHHMRFWPVYDSTGKLVPNTYLMAMDYTAVNENYDYNDNVYLITNMKPAAPATPASPAAVGSSAGVNVSWAAVNDPLLVGYQLYRSTSANGVYSLLNSTPLTSTSYLDSNTTTGTTYYYTVAAIDSFGSVSGFTAAVSAVRM